MKKYIDSQLTGNPAEPITATLYILENDTGKITFKKEGFYSFTKTMSFGRYIDARNIFYSLT